MRPLAELLGFLCWFCLFYSSAPFTVDSDNSVFIDDTGRQRFWHGVNMVRPPPFVMACKQRHHLFDPEKLRDS
eukprot:1179431-Prorocentrum_minimum.AAC.2